MAIHAIRRPFVGKAEDSNIIFLLIRTKQFCSFFSQYPSLLNIDPLSVSLSASVPPLHDLSTIDIDTFECLSAEVDASLSVHSPAPAAPAASTLETSAAPTPEPSAPHTLETSAALTLETSAVPTPPTLARTVSSNSAVDSAVEIPVAEDVIRTCVTPRKVQQVREALQKEVNRHRCAVNLLPFFFTKEEIMNSNTDGSHGKQCLDSNKLNSLKVLVFSKFPVESATEKDKLWAFIKTKINARCRAIKYANTTRAQ